MIQTVLRVILSGGLLTAILMTINVEEAFQLVGRSNLILLAVAALVLLTVRIVTALRWFVLLRACGVEISYAVVLRISFVSTAVGQFIPGGADAASIYQVFKESGKLSEISVAVFLDRLFGIAAMLIIATAGVYGAVEEIWIRNLVLTMAICFVMLLFLSTRLIGSDFLRNFLSSRLKSRFHRVARGALRLIGLVSDRSTLKKATGPIILASIAVQILRILAFFAIYASLGADIPIVYFVAFVPLVYLVLSMPISIAGLGVRESALVVLFGTVGVAAEVSVTAGLLMPLLLLFAVIPGLILLSVGSSTSRPYPINPAPTDNHK
jgi:uncharacterized protein (TIRG00374 family)